MKRSITLALVLALTGAGLAPAQDTGTPSEDALKAANKQRPYSP